MCRAGRGEEGGTVTASAAPSFPASEYMDETRSVRDEDPVSSGGPHLKCPQCDRRLESGAITPTWVCEWASCPTPSITEGGVRR
jgi:hypothetical protein